MATISGKAGSVKAGNVDVAEVTEWELTVRSHNPAYASSSTGGWKTRRPGVKEASGSVALKLDVARNVFTEIAEGTAVELKLYLDATRFYLVPAVVEELRWVVDINQGDVVGGVMKFASTGAVIPPALGSG